MQDKYLHRRNSPAVPWLGPQRGVWLQELTRQSASKLLNSKEFLLFQ